MLFDVQSPAQSGFERDVLAPPCGSCFHCGREIQRTAVLWRGASTTLDYPIALHPECAQQLGAHLIKDGLIGARIDAGQDPLTGLVPVTGRF